MGLTGQFSAKSDKTTQKLAIFNEPSVDFYPSLKLCLYFTMKNALFVAFLWLIFVFLYLFLQISIDGK